MKSILIKNAEIHNAIVPEAAIGDILIIDGKIAQIGPGLTGPDGIETIDACGLRAYPGFVEAHCHIGLDGHVGYPELDINESTDPITPQIRGIDAVNPMSHDFLKAAKAGVTTVSTGPGSANVVGGTFLAMKTIGRRVDDMVVKNPVAMKCAFGENPSNRHQGKNINTRMGTAFRLRELLLKTREYMTKIVKAGDDMTNRPSFDMKLDAMIPVLEGALPLKVHAHQANDIFTAIRIAREFNLKITLDHCTEGHLIADYLAAEKYPVAVGPTMSGITKFEVWNKVFTTPGILAKAGCQVSIITDSPVVVQEFLPIAAGLAVKNGMEPFAALQAITINPARHVGIEDRVGSLEAGKDGDVILADGDPLALSTRIVHTIINGKVLAE